MEGPSVWPSAAEPEAKMLAPRSVDKREAFKDFSELAHLLLLEFFITLVLGTFGAKPSLCAVARLSRHEGNRRDLSLSGEGRLGIIAIPGAANGSPYKA